MISYFYSVGQTFDRTNMSQDTIALKYIIVFDASETPPSPSTKIGPSKAYKVDKGRKRKKTTTQYFYNKSIFKSQPKQKKMKDVRLWFKSGPKHSGSGKSSP